MPILANIFAITMRAGDIDKMLHVFRRKDKQSTLLTHYPQLKMMALVGKKQPN
jgi:hypothetical protein